MRKGRLPRPAPIVRAVLPLPVPAPKARAPAVVPVVPVVDTSLIGRRIHNTFRL